MTTAVPTGETFARSPTFVIEGETVENPCVDVTPAADCCVDFLKKHGVDKVLIDNIGRRAMNLLEEEGITAVTGEPATANPGKGSFESWIENKSKFLGFTALTLGGAWALIQAYKYLKD